MSTKSLNNVKEKEFFMASLTSAVVKEFESLNNGLNLLQPTLLNLTACGHLLIKLRKFIPTFITKIGKIYSCPNSNPF